MEFLTAFIAGLTFIVATLTLLLMIRKQKFDDLWGEVLHFQNSYQLLDEWMLRAKSPDSIIQWCAVYMGKDKTDEIKSAVKRFKERAERLKLWYVFW